MKKQTSYEQPHDMGDVDVAFPSTLGALIPPKEDIPNEFHDYHHNPFGRHALNLFFHGGDIGELKDGIDASKAIRHLASVLRSFEPSQEHKMAAAAYLLSLWLKECPKHERTQVQ